MKAGLSTSPTGEEVVLGLPPELQPVEEDSPPQGEVGLEAPLEAVVQEAEAAVQGVDVSVAAKKIVHRIQRAVWPFGFIFCLSVYLKNKS
jgi:hypothetical protein